jgi:hypothetical protein
MTTVTELFAGSGSGVAEFATPVSVTFPAGIVKLTLQTMPVPAASATTGGDGVQLTSALAGAPVTVHVALVAASGPLFAHVTVPVTVAPALALVGNPLTLACMSADGTIGVTSGPSELFVGFGSVVPSGGVIVALLLRLPLAGAVP